MPDDEPGTERESPTGRDRLLAALTARPSRGQAVVGVLLATVGFAAMTQVQSNERDDTYSSLRQSDLIRVLDGLAGTSQRAEDEIDRLRQTRDDLRTSTSSRQAALEQARQEASTLSILAGTVPTVGPGVRITITDDRGEIQDDTLLDVVQELRAAGAEAISINGHRLTNVSPIRNVGDAIHIKSVPLRAPYTVLAVGDTNTLQARFGESVSGVAWASLKNSFGFDFSMANADSLELPGSLTPTLRSAEQAPEGPDKEVGQ